MATKKRIGAVKRAALPSAAAPEVAQVQAAYQDAVKNLAAQFLVQFISDGSAAEERLRRGLEVTRQARDRALAVVGG